MLKRSVLVLAVVLAVVLVALAACKEKEKPAKTYPIVGKIVSREIQSNSLVIQHQKIEGFMEAMTMPFPVKGTNVNDLPPDGSPIHATLHVAEDEYWVTDVKSP